MKTTMSRAIPWAAAFLALTVIARAAEPVYPVKVSENGRYFIDQKGEPVFWLGTTQWQLFREFSLEDARTILEKSKEKGFTFVQVMLTGVGDGTRTNILGDKPWRDDNPLKAPNHRSWRNFFTRIKARMIAGK